MKLREPSTRDRDSMELVATIFDIGVLAQRTGDLDETLRAIIQRILEELDACYVRIALISRSGDEIVHTMGLTRDGMETPKGHTQPIDSGVVGQVVRTGEALVVDDTAVFPDYVPIIDGMRSEMTVPLKIGGRLIGALDAESERVSAFGSQSQALLQALATPVAQALEIARLSHIERHRMHQLTVLNRVSQVITSTVDLDQLLQRTVEDIREQFGYFCVALGLWDEDSQVMVLHAVSSEEPLQIPIGYSQSIGVGVVGEVAQTKRSVLVHDTQARENYVPIVHEVRCEMCAPLLVGDRLIGCLNVEDMEPYRFGNEDLLLLEMLAKHISQAVENARNIRSMNELRDDLYNMVVHDMRNPLTAISSTIGVLERQCRNDGGKEDALRERSIQRAKLACDELLVMLDGMLDLHQIEAGALSLDLRAGSVSDMFEGIVEWLQVFAEAQELELRCHVHDDLPPCRFDHNLIKRVLQNLAINALKFTPPGGSVEMRVSSASSALLGERLPSSQEAVLFEVRDTGPGIPPEYQEKVFEKFATLVVSREGPRRSTGLGLAFCRQAVRAHRGAIWVESERGQGSAFRVLLPGDPLGR